MFRNGRLMTKLDVTQLIAKGASYVQHPVSRQFHQEGSSHQNAEEGNNFASDSHAYDTHIHSSPLQKMLLGVGSSILGLLDPTRADLVAVSGETTGAIVLPCLLRKMQEDPEGQDILRERPVINSRSVDLEGLARLPDGTLGREYVRFLQDQRVTPDSRDPVRFVDDADQAYVMQRYRESHDLVHTLLGMPTSLLGEVTVKWVEGLQTGLPMCIGGGLLAPLRLKPKHRQLYWTTCLPWALRAGRQARFLLSVYWERRWHQQLEELRQGLHVPPPPALS
ncbi:ubiquinone biosynthesis protein COQ4 homolog, mitochondrial-like isoform X2 [Pollicipes pollicipes]|nr:ubiquinone biosynthesis protein COQ4 homolog, mitochondrial-like isoform X2 [Pollicipes pollicipes]XP_037090530.1 ubiquinone biosynthesis protein COQ4 homolog, mitochondrial-like isoform X2 [Pollicipes pollicipes]XP_037090531.1 ubiquinone biosynthesis protein COQ4 homolog, mitochondrial-like isoform X2 [Pollicipes pollicipes]